MNSTAAGDYELALSYAVRYLGYAARTRKQLRDKMTEKEFSDEAIHAVMQLLTEKGYLDDIAFAQNYIAAKTRYNNYGRRRIVVGLMQKGVGKEDIQAAYSAYLEQDNENEELEAARRALSKRVAKRVNHERHEKHEKEKLVAYLMRRGFSYDVIKKAMENQEL